MKIQVKDCATGGIFQMEPARADGTATVFTHLLGDDVFYFDNPNVRDRLGENLPCSGILPDGTPVVCTGANPDGTVDGDGADQLRQRFLGREGDILHLRRWRDIRSPDARGGALGEPGPVGPRVCVETHMSSQAGPTTSDRSSLSFALLAFALVATGGTAPHRHGHAARSDGFRAMTADAVARMHAAMEVPFTGDADRDFARMMIPHHQGAIDMALAELRYGKDERLKRLAQEIIVEQQQEIAVMHLALGDVPTPGAAAPTQVQAAPGAHREQ